MKRHFDAIVLGGGAAGLMCALTAGQRGRRVVVLEHSDRIGKKILISGGGRCNFTNAMCHKLVGAARFPSRDPNKDLRVRPDLVPLRFDSQARQHDCDLAGVSAEAIATFGRQKLSPKDADHAPRLEPPGHPADFVLTNGLKVAYCN